MACSYLVAYKSVPEVPSEEQARKQGYEDRKSCVEETDYEPGKELLIA